MPSCVHNSRMRSKLLWAKYASPTPRISSTIRISGVVTMADENISREHMPVEYVFIGWSMYSSISANATISSNRSAAARPTMPWCASVAKTFWRPVKSGWKPDPICSRLLIATVHVDRPGCGNHQPGDDLQHRRLAGAVAADDGDLFATTDREIDVVERLMLRV